MLNYLAAFFNGVFVSLFWVLKYREARAAEALHKAEAERHLLSKHAVESELKLMQAQVEPHFLFNTLATVQHLIDIDPPRARRLRGPRRRALRPGGGDCPRWEGHYRAREFWRSWCCAPESTR